MGKITFVGGDEFISKLENINRGLGKRVWGKALYQGAKIVADEIRRNLGAIPTDDRRYKPGMTFSGPTTLTKKALQASLGITPMKQDRWDAWNLKVGGFEGYTKAKTKRWPKGQPLPMLARSVESGTSRSEKHPFVRPAVERVGKIAQAEMANAIEAEVKKLLRG